MAGYDLRDLFGIVYLPTVERRFGERESFIPYNNLRTFSQRHGNINNALYHLKRRDPEAFEGFVSNVKSFFPEITELDIEFDLDTGHVGFRVKEGATDVSLTESGSGTCSFVSLFAHLLWPNVQIAIMDEPDIHLHSGLVKDLVKFLKRLTPRIQFIVTSHNEAFINQLALEDMLSVAYTGLLTSSVAPVTDLDIIFNQLAEIGVDPGRVGTAELQQFGETRAGQDTKTFLSKVEQVAEQVRERVESAQLSYYRPEELQAVETSHPIEPGSEAAQLMERLKACPPGREQWREYEIVCRDILVYCLVPPLEPPTEQVYTEDQLERRDLVFQIPHDSSNLWGWLHGPLFNCVGIIFDPKNYSEELNQDEAYIVTKYIGERRLTTVAIVLTRIGLSLNARKRLADCYRTGGKLVVCLNDGDLLRMLELKEAGEDPAKVIDNAIRSFLMGLGLIT